MKEDLARRLVDNEVLLCVSGLVNTAIREGWDSDALVDSVCYRPDWEDAAFEYLLSLSLGELADVYEETLGTAEGAAGDRSELSAAIVARLNATERGHEDFCRFHGVDPHEDEVYEHWVVTDWLAERLREKGEPVCFDWQNLTIWGRCTTGQSMTMDSVIRKIATETYSD